MLLTLTTTHQPATDLGYLLHKHPDRVRTIDVARGQAHVLFPEATDERCTAALVVELDPVALVRGTGRGRPGEETTPLGRYVDDRPYASASMLAVAMGGAFRTALNGRCENRPELVGQALPFEVHLPVVAVRGGEAVLRALFEPLGYEVAAAALPLDPTQPAWGDSRYLDLTLRATVVLADLLSHLYVLLPALDGAKHYWIGEAEAEKLLARGEGWLAGHPARELITRRYLGHRRALTAPVLSQLAEDDPEEPGGDDAEADREEMAVEEKVSLSNLRTEAVLAAVTAAGAGRVVDLGCGEGRLMAALLRTPGVTHVTGLDVSARALERAESRLRLDRMSERQAERVALIHGGLTYRDERLRSFDVAALVEVIEHVDPDRLDALERTVFAHARPTTVIVTTPNIEHNVRFETLAAGSFRHTDHRFEWTRAEMSAWCERVAARHGYRAEISAIGDDDPEVGPPTQMAVFTLDSEPSADGPTDQSTAEREEVST